MSNPSETIRRSLLEYPICSASVGAVLAHLFCTLGNGYDWVNGELVDGDDDNVPEESLINESIAMFNGIIAADKEKFPTDNGASLAPERALNNYKFTVNNIDRYASMDGIRHAIIGLDVYPCYPLAKIFHVPDNVTTEWLWAAYYFVSQWQYELTAKIQLTEQAKKWIPALPAVDNKLRNMLIARNELPQVTII